MFTYHVVFDIRDKKFAERFYNLIRKSVDYIRVDGIKNRIEKSEPIRIKFNVNCHERKSGQKMLWVHEKLEDIAMWCSVKPLETIVIE